MKRVYRNIGYTIETSQISVESKNLMDKVKDELDIKLNYKNADDNTSEAQQNK